MGHFKDGLGRMINEIIRSFKSPRLGIRPTRLGRKIVSDSGLPSHPTYCDPRWVEAKIKSQGYDSQIILDRAIASALAVKNGEAAYERDTVLFKASTYRWQMLACVMSVAASKKGRIHILDIGGSLASVFLQHRAFFDLLPNLTWSIVEQPHLAAAGRLHLQVAPLHFFDSIDAAQRFRPIDMTLFLSSLQYMPNPYETLKRIAKTGASHLIVDRIPLSDLLDDEVAIQQVPDEIYPASYPQWRLSEAKLLRFIGDDLGFIEKVRYCDGIDGDDHSGFFFERI